MIFHKKFWLRFVGYIMVVLLIHIVLFIFLGGVAMANDIDTEERQGLAAIPLFIIIKILGFPLAFFFEYDPVSSETLNPGLVIIFLLNCLIQFSILSFVWRKSRN